MGGTMINGDAPFTPTSSFSLSDKTRSDLEWDRLLGALAEHCMGPLGRDAAMTLELPSAHDESRSLLRETDEAMRLRARGEPLPIAEVADVREGVARVRIGGALAPGELRAIAALLAAARTLRRFLSAHRSEAPTLYAAYATDPTLDKLEGEISSCFELDGTLSDRASARLRELRGEHQTARARMLSRLEDLMGRYGAVLQDRFVTEREGRYVVPVRSDAHERFPGIVHATSASGATLFVEPRAVVPLGNRLKVLDAEVAREEQAVYVRLSSLLGESLASLEAAVSAVARADLRAAAAALAEEHAYTIPELLDGPRLELRAARHPLLCLDVKEVVPSDLELAGGRAMIVSGPNAGGKTVALKTMGLCALLVRAGLPCPCAEGSRMGLFDAVLTDVGDDQNLTKNLSTFSAHVSNIVRILEDTGPGALVLLDELAGGTDPREGEALAAAVIDSLCARGGAVAATTHYEGLKALALADERFVNASVGFDIATLTPTFRLAIGVPGSSSALAVAARYGLPSLLVERARGFLAHEDRNFEALVKQLNAERAALELARKAAEEREAEAEHARVRFEAERELVRSRERELLSREGEALLARVRRAKEELHAAQARLRAKKLDEPQLRELGRSVERVARDLAIGGELEPLIARPSERHDGGPLRPSELRVGARVYVPRLRADAQILELQTSGAVRIAAGALKMVVAAEDLREPMASGAPQEKKPRATTSSVRSGEFPSPPLEVPFQTSDNRCDLRGLRADDAVAMATTFLDRSVNEGRPTAFLIHGHGTGALREAIRRELTQSRYVAHFRPGTPEEGGDGVTVVWLS